MDTSIENVDPLVLPGLEGIKEETEVEEAVQRTVSEPERSIITEVEILSIISKWDAVKNYLNNITIYEFVDTLKSTRRIRRHVIVDTRE